MDGPSGTRTLMAIVFTDVAGFSRAAALDEERAVARLNHDIAIMRDAASRHSGRVANTMGDGVLMLFASAVDAMACALEIQRLLHEENQAVPFDRRLHHRIGVHLGDVIVDGDNVFGDGVNVAARLESESKPDGICYSRTIHDVILHKLDVPSVYIGPRALKNIPDRVMLWQVPPLDEASTIPPDAYTSLVVEPEGTGGAKGIAMVAISVFLVCLVVGGGAAFLVNLKNRRPVVPVVSTPPPIARPKVEKPLATPKTDLAEVASLETLKQSYQFDALADALEQSGAKTQPGGLEKISEYRNLADLKRWMESQLGQSSADRPVPVTIDLGNGPVPYSVYNGPGGLVVDPGANPTLYPLDKFPPAAFAALATALGGATPPASVTAGIAAFTREYGG